jgi:hypothetical protein
MFNNINAIIMMYNTLDVSDSGISIKAGTRQYVAASNELMTPINGTFG